MPCAGVTCKVQILAWDWFSDGSYSLRNIMLVFRPVRPASRTLLTSPVEMLSATLCVVRRLSTVLFPHEPFTGLDELLRSFAAVDLEQASARNNSPLNPSLAPAGKISERSSAGGAAVVVGQGAGKEESLVWHVDNVAARFGSLVEVSAWQYCIVVAGNRSKEYSRKWRILRSANMYEVVTIFSYFVVCWLAPSVLCA